MDIFVAHGRSRSVISAAPDETPAEILVRAGAPGELHLEGRDEPLDPAVGLAAQGVVAGAKLFAGTCRRVSVRVQFGGDAKTTSEPPTKALRAILAWAAGPQGFNLPEAEHATHTLTVCDSGEEPDLSDHIGSLAGADCEVCLNLVPQQKFEG
jgi:hypothetical protein